MTGRAWLALAVSLAALNASLTFVNVWPTPRIAWGSTLSIELAACVLLLALTYRWRSRLARVILPALWIVLVFGRYLAVTAPGLYGREFNLYWDSQHLGNVAAMLGRAAPWWLIGTGVAVALLSVALAYGLARVAFHQVAAVMERQWPRRALSAAAVITIVMFGGYRAVFEQVPGRESVFANPVTPAYARQARFVAAMMGPEVAAPSLGESPDFQTGLRGIAGSDVILVFAESYGAITFETPEVAGPLAASREQFERAIRESGREVMSAFVDSPTFGGGSWLAHLTLITGLDIRDQYAYTSVMASPRETILTNFERRGYRTVALMPGMRQAWPEGEFYGFDVIYGRDALEYTGPQFGWWSIPDQYALAKLDALERGRNGKRQPILAVFPTSTTHAPFGPVAPYQPDWARLLTKDAFEPADVERAMAQQPDLTNMRPAYVRAMAYQFESLAGYLRQQQDDLIMVVVGDHQPPAAVSGPDAPWHVPVHVIASKPGVLQHLSAQGFRPGLAPPPTPIGGMHALTPALLQAFDALPTDAEDR